MDVTPVGLIPLVPFLGGPSTWEAMPREMRPADIEAHFNATGLPLQTFNVYEHLAAMYNSLQAQGKTDNEIAKAIMTQAPALFIAGDAKSVAYGVTAVALTIRKGYPMSEVDRSPTWKEAYDMGLGKLTGPWDSMPSVGKIALVAGAAAAVVYLVPGMFGRYKRARG